MKQARSCVDGSVAFGLLPFALFGSEPKPNIHRDDDRNLKVQKQGYEAVDFWNCGPEVACS